MYSSIVEHFIKALVQEGFSLSSAMDMGILQENSSVLLHKEESPVLYIVTLQNAEKRDLKEHELFMEQYLEHLQKNISFYYCSTIIAVTIVIGEFVSEKNENAIAAENALEFVSNKEFIPDGKCFHVWWYLSEKKKRIIMGKNQPDTILNLKKIALSSLDTSLETEQNEKQNISLKEIVNHAQQENAFPIKSDNTTLTWFLLLINGLILLSMLFLDKKNEWILLFGVEKNAVFQLHEYYRLITACFIHTGIIHFVQNSVYLYFFGTPTEVLYGKIEMLVIYFVSGLGGSLLSAFCNDTISVGASGAIFGLIGAILIYSHQNGKRSIGINYSTILFLAVFGLIIGLLEENVDYFGHLGGFIAGAFSAFLLLKKTKKHHADQ